jgi:hypothetical protein
MNETAHDTASTRIHSGWAFTVWGARRAALV